MLPIKIYVLIVGIELEEMLETTVNWPFVPYPRLTIREPYGRSADPSDPEYNTVEAVSILIDGSKIVATMNTEYTQSDETARQLVGRALANGWVLTPNQ